MSELVFVHNRYAWERKNFSTWEEFLPVNGMLMPYREGLAPLLAGDDENIWEVHPAGIDSAEQSFKSGFIVRKENSYHVYSGTQFRGESSTVGNAVEMLRQFNKEIPPLNPQYCYLKPEGRLVSILQDPQSVLVFICGWKNFRRQGEELVELNAEQRNQFGGYLNQPYWTIHKYHTDQSFRSEIAKFPFKEEIIEIRSEQFHPNSLYYDSVVHVLSPEYTDNPATVEFFKNNMLALAEKYDIDAVLVKEKQDIYASGCRREEFLGEYKGYQVRQLANFQQRDTFEGAPLQAVFEYMDKIKNNDYSIVTYPHKRRKTQWLEEGLPRPQFTLGSMAKAMAYYQKSSTLYRRQWQRIQRDNSAVKNKK